MLLGFGQDSSTKHVQLQIVNALRLGERGMARDLLADLSDGNNAVSADDFLHILRYCAKSPDPSVSCFLVAVYLTTSLFIHI